MDKKRLQRLIGILVVLALVVITLPLIFGKNDAVTRSSIVQAPPLPDQESQVQPTPETASATQSNDDAAATQIASSDSSSSAIPTPDAASTDATNTTSPDTFAAAPAPAQTNQDTNPDQQAAPSSPVASNEASPAAPAPSTDQAAASAQTPTTATTAQDKSSEVVKIGDLANDPNDFSTAPQSTEEKATTNVQAPSTNVKPEASNAKNQAKIALQSHPSLHKYAATAWVVQLGSFKVKGNAEKLVDKLRHSGYKAFTRESNHVTKVFIGPENQKMAAANLSTKLQAEYNMHGFVTSYKPLEL